MEGCFKALFNGFGSGIKKLSFIERREDLFADSADRSLSKNKGQKNPVEGNSNIFQAGMKKCTGSICKKVKEKRWENILEQTVIVERLTWI